MNINRLLFQKIDDNILNSCYKGINSTSYHKSNSFINNISIVVNVGGLQTIPGAAHFLEHMKFWYNDTNLYDTMNRLHTILNATTSEFITDYSLCCTRHEMVNSINHVLVNLYNHLFTVDIFEKEKKVIINEIKGYDLIVSDEKQLDFIRKIIGQVSEVQSLTIEELTNLSVEHYHKDNTHIYIYGDISDIKDFCTTNIYNEKILYIKIKFPEKECTISGRSTEILIKILYLTFCEGFDFTYHSRYIKTNQSFKEIKKIDLNSREYLNFKDNSFVKIVDLLEDPNNALVFLEFFKVQKGDFSRFYDYISNKTKLEELLDNLMMEVNFL